MVRRGSRHRRELRSAEPLRLTGAVLSGVALVLAVPMLFSGLFLLLVMPQDAPVYADTSQQAECSVVSAVRGSTTTVTLPLEQAGSTGPVWYIRGIDPLGSSNAIVSSKQFIGATVQGSVRFEVRPMNPDLPYSFEAVRVTFGREDQAWHQVMRLALRSDAGDCQVDVGQVLQG
ncbi:hypothetical protein [Herbiconiux sp. VKM Ac-2851]|uniref:hypothetical protein n=1 Tax=Herbiconiux sp. VKM Ac-2851 TaxID=2739025 RepID=UPI00156480F2|nr:hypothetical protein [Herbiconiux sp. VKM Ac-2851]NQX33276.1 hypothetical protein [Herbiconiux sp. VKM Ac-2851]